MIKKIEKFVDNAVFLKVLMALLLLVGFVTKIFNINMDFLLFLLLICWLATSLFISFEKSVCVLLFLMALPILEFKRWNFSFDSFMLRITMVVFGVKYLIKVCKKEEKISLLPLILSILLILYSLIDFKKFDMITFLGNITLIASIYIFFVYRDSVSRESLFDYASIGLIINILLAGFLCVFPSLRGTFITEGRFMGFFSNPNSLAVYTIITLSIGMLHFLRGGRKFKVFCILSYNSNRWGFYYVKSLPTLPNNFTNYIFNLLY